MRRANKRTFNDKLQHICLSSPFVLSAVFTKLVEIYV